NDEDDDLPEGSTLPYFRCRQVYLFIHIQLRQFPVRSPQHQVVHGSLYYDDRTVYDQTEVDSTQRHEVGTHPKYMHHTKGKQKRQRYGRCHNKPRPHVAQEEYQHKDDDERTFYKVFGNGMYGTVYQVGTVQEGFYLHVCRQRLLYHFHLLLHPFHHLCTVGTFQHHHHAAHYFAFAIAGHRAVAQGMPQAWCGYMAYQYGYAVLGLYYYIAYIFQRLYQAQPANEISIRVLFYIGAAGIGVVLFQC